MVRRKGVSLSTKLKILDDITNNLSTGTICEKHGVSRWLVARLRKEAIASTISVLAGDKSQKNQCRQRPAQFQHLEGQLMDWIAKKNRDKCIISTSILKAKALKIRDFLHAQDEETASASRTFKASNGWLQRFKTRWRLASRSVEGMETTFDNIEVGRMRETFRHRLAGFLPEDIFNIDETSLFYKQLPLRSFTQAGNVRKDGKREKERLTIVLGCSRAGEKLKPMVIGRSARPRDLRNTDLTRLPCAYRNNKKAWLTRAIFKDHLSKFNEEMHANNRHVCFVLDNFSGHFPLEEYSNIQLIYLPPGTTSVLQPLDAGIIRSFKSNYSRMINDKQIKASDENQPFKHSIKDAIFMAAVAWGNIPELLLRNCWRKTAITAESIFDIADAISD
jgi:hypothetical protein